MQNYQESHRHLASFRNFCHMYDIAYEKHLNKQQTAKYCPFDEANSKLQTIYCLTRSRNSKMTRKSMISDLGMYTRRKALRRSLKPSQISPNFEFCKLSSRDLADMFMDYVVTEYIDNYVTVERLKNKQGREVDEATKKSMKRKSQTIDYTQFLEKYLKSTTVENAYGRGRCFRQISKKLLRRHKRAKNRLAKSTGRSKKDQAEHTKIVMAAINALWTEVLIKMIEVAGKIPVLEKIAMRLPREFI